MEETAHGPSCNCEDCWWHHECSVVDEFGVPAEESETSNSETPEETHTPDPTI